MFNAPRELARLAFMLTARGLALFAFGGLASIWPERSLVPGLILVALSSTLLGIYEISIGISLRGHAHHWLLVTLHGVASVAFGMLSGGVTALDWLASMAIVMQWMLAYAWLMFTAAAVIGSRTLFKALLACGVAHVMVSAAILILHLTSTLQLLYFGALYAALFGVWQVVLGWLVTNRVQVAAGHWGRP